MTPGEKQALRFLDTTMTFREFLNESAASDLNDVRETVRKLPEHHRRLVRGYKVVFQNGHTMKGDGGHVGLIDTEKKKIILSAPFHYGRQFVLLHEIGHLIWNRYVTEKHKKEWSRILKATKHKAKDTEEELFAMAYASHFAQNRIVVHDHPTWHRFIEKICKLT